MKKSIVLLSFLMIMSIKVIADIEYSGNLRLGYQKHRITLPSLHPKENEFAIGMQLNAKSQISDNLEVGASLFTTSGDGDNSFKGIPFFDRDNNNYGILGELYIKGTFGKTELTLGRQEIDTPFADSDDIGMIPNRFEAVTLINKDLKDTTIFFSHIYKWSGVDSETPSRFTKVNDDYGMQVLGVNYEGFKDISLSGWFYNIQKEVKIAYFEANYQNSDYGFTYGSTLQYSYHDYDNGESSSIYGVAVELGYKEIGLNTRISYNKNNGVSADNFFGGGPYVTNAEHNTLREAGIDGNTILYTIEWDASVVGLDGLTISTNIDSHHGEQYHAKEYDLGWGYKYNDKLNLSVVYSDIEDRVESFRNLRAFVDYSF